MSSGSCTITFHSQSVSQSIISQVNPYNYNFGRLHTQSSNKVNQSANQFSQSVNYLAARFLYYLDRLQSRNTVNQSISRSINQSITSQLDPCVTCTVDNKVTVNHAVTIGHFKSQIGKSSGSCTIR